VKSKDKKSFDLLVKVPGEGKTSRMLAMATTMHTVLLNFTRLATFNSIFFKDPSLQMMEKHLNRYDHFGMIQHAHREVDQK
jgi:ribosomal protein S9